MEIISRKEAKERGLKKYFTGKPCKHGHVDSRITVNANCETCVKNLNMRPDQIEKKKRYGNQHYKQNKEKKAAYAKEWWALNPGKGAEYMRKWREANRDRSREIGRISESRRRAGMKGASSREVTEWLRKQDMTCYWCGVACDQDYHIDHYIPISKGGEHEVRNFVISCPRCNVSKKDKDPYEYANSLGKLF